MKKLKFIVAIVAITLATFGSISNVNARKDERTWCVNGGSCGTTPTGQTISGSVTHTDPNG